MTEGVFTRRCSRYPSNTFTQKSPVDENFVISITGNAQTYILGQSYNVSLHAYNGHRFVSAKLVLENENGEKGYNEDLGRLEVTDPVETQYSQKCFNMIESTNTNPKTRLDMAWIAPSAPGNGCVLIRATVLQHRDVWFMDDGGLTKRICEEVVDDVESQKKDTEERQCCVCDEARYELTFESLWSRNLHPKDFPTQGWLTRFSDIIGAAHTSDYRFWDKGVLATPEMQEFAKHGSTRGLEREFNLYFKDGKIRTIIKARGPAFPYINSPSIASVRVDPLHHQLSIASKIIPSPDWIVGVPGLELCLANCTWLDKKVINLYPWDIGTDAGPSYTSPDQPQFPADVIRRMSSLYPADPRSPFFDETNAPMKPLATLTIKRQRLYERKCEDEQSNSMENIPRECYTHPWSAWSECTAECGEGRQYRTRVYKQPSVAKIYNCDRMVKRKQERSCQGQICSNMQSVYAYPNSGPSQWSVLEDEEEAFETEISQMPVKSAKSKAECMVGKWSLWSQCNATCGEGVMERRREYINPYNEKECQKAYFLKLNEYKKCQGMNCLGRISNEDNPVEHYENDNFNTLEYGTNPYSYGAHFKPQHKSYVDMENSKQYGLKNRIHTEQNDKPGILQQYARARDLTQDYNYNAAEEEQEEAQYNFQAEDLKQEPSEEESEYLPLRMHSKFNNIKATYHKNNQPITTTHNTRQNYDDRVLKSPPEYCYQPLNIVHACDDPRVIGNFWFYNYCTDECMLYTTDICDRNRNKFSSLEQCEEQCAQPIRSLGRHFLTQKQAQGCRSGLQNGHQFKRKKYHNF